MNGDYNSHQEMDLSLPDIIIDHKNTLQKLKPSYQDFIKFMTRFKNKYTGKFITERIIISQAKYIFDKLKNIDDCDFSKLPFMNELHSISVKFKTPRIYVKHNEDANFSKATTTPLVNNIFESTFRDQMDKGDKIPDKKRNCGICIICLRPNCNKCKQCKLKTSKKRNVTCVRKICPNMVSIKTNEKPSKPINNVIKNNTVEWIGFSICDNEKLYYNSVVLNGLKINSGDFVLASTKENDSFHLIFKVIFFWMNTKDSTNWFHGQIYLRGTDTLLSGVSNRKEIYMQENCSTQIPLHYISSVLNVKRLKTEENWQVNGTKPQSLNHMKNLDYFYRKYYNRDLVRFEDIPNDPKCVSESNKHKFCPSCYRRCHAWLKKLPRVKNIVKKNEQQFLTEGYYEWNDLHWNGNVYRKGTGLFLKNRTFNLTYETPLKNAETVTLKKVDNEIFTEYYRKFDKSKIKGSNQYPPIPYCVGYISNILTRNIVMVNPQDISIVVNVLLRPQNIPGYKSENADLNILFWTEEQVMINLSKIRGSCDLAYVDNINGDLIKWSLNDSNRFYFKSAYDFENSKFYDVPNYAKNVGLNINHISKKKIKPLKSLDIFAGCGGLSKGLHESQIADCRWAVENDFSAAQAFLLNNKNCTVYVEDCNKLLKDIMDEKTHSSAKLPLPRRGEVEMICCGPPCQGFSSMNRFSSNEYSMFKNSLIVSSLSYCDYFRPKYFILENVRNFVSYKCGMILKLTMHCLLEIGYQCTFKVLQAGSFGIPQTRRRMIIIAAAPGQPLPNYPEATHSFNHSSSLNVKIDGTLYGPIGITRAAPRRTCTIRDAIGDLPKIDNGHEDIEISYTSKPKFDYRKIIRDNSDVLRDHICKSMSPLNHARICNVPPVPGADWRDLPNIVVDLSDGKKTKVLEYRYKGKRANKKPGVCRCIDGTACSNSDRQNNTLIPWFLPHTADRHSNWAGVIGRLSWGGYFSTTLTNPQPLGKQGRVLHPDQNRIVSVRECARSQGFPDSYLFFGNIQDKYKQIGNAVPPPLAFALGQEIVAAQEHHRFNDYFFLDV